MGSAAEKRPIKVNVLTTILIDGDKQEIELTVFGHYYKKMSAHYLQYEEVHEEGKMNTVMKLTADEVVIIRNGILKMRLYFSRNTRRRGMYETPYGKLPIYTKTTFYKHIQNERSLEGHVDLQYDLFMDGTKTGQYKLQLTYEEAADEHR